MHLLDVKKQSTQMTIFRHTMYFFVSVSITRHLCSGIFAEGESSGRRKYGDPLILCEFLSVVSLTTTEEKKTLNFCFAL